MKKNIADENLWHAINIALNHLEKNEEIVVCSANFNRATDSIYEAVLQIVPQTTLTEIELSGLRALTLEAIDDKKFFDWEMPILTGYDTEGFRKIAMKLPNV